MLLFYKQRSYFVRQEPACYLLALLFLLLLYQKEIGLLNIVLRLKECPYELKKGNKNLQNVHQKSYPSEVKQRTKSLPKKHDTNEKVTLNKSPY